MSWTTPATWVAGYLVTDTDMNTQVRDNLNFLVTTVFDTNGKIQNLAAAVKDRPSGRTIHNAFTQVNNSLAAETTLDSFTFNPDTNLAVTGHTLRMTAWGIYANNANAKTVRTYFGALIDGFAGMITTSAAGMWEVETHVMAIAGTGAQTAVCRFRGGPSASSLSKQHVQITALSQSGAITVKTTGQATANSDISLLGCIVELLKVA